MKYAAPACLLLLALLLLPVGCTELDQLIGMGEEAACSGTAVRVADIDQDHCYQDAAIRKGDTALCSRIERAPPRTKCIMLIAEKKGDKSICEQMEDYPGSGEYSRIECLQRVAVKTGDASVCDEIGTASVSYMFAGEISRETCYERTGTGSPQPLQRLYAENPENFRQCQDLAYAAVFNRAPSTNTGASKQEVGEKLLSSSYTITSKGCVAEGATPNVPLSNGDVIVFDWDALPDPKNGAHYAVVENGKISQILNFPTAGAYNQTGDIAWFFARRTVYDPYNNNQPMASPRVYHCYTVYHKAGATT